MFPIEYRVANFVGRVQNTLESAEHMTPKSAQNANPYMRCSYDMLAHDVYSSSTSTGVSGWLGSMPALRAHATSSSAHASVFIVIFIRASSRPRASSPVLVVVAHAHQADFIDPFLHHGRHESPVSVSARV
jgi:hypothetical protein